MNTTYTVQYELNTDPNPTESSAFSSNTTVNNLQMDVQATGMSQARAMIEAMFGGQRRCHVKSVIQK